jgi:hypothetical protein
LVGRATALLALGAALAVYYATSESWWEASTWWDVAFLGACLIPAVFALVWLVLPWWNSRGLFALGLSFAVLAALLSLAGADAAANFAKLFAVTAIGFWFLRWFETAAWVVLVAVIIPWVDAYSVWRGPTKHILAHQKEIFGYFSFSFPIPGEHASAALGLPDLLFFAVFLAASARFRLRPGWTWVLMTASFGTTLALVVGFTLTGLPALPLLSIAFLAPNADLLWRRIRGTRHPSVTP